MTFSHSVNVVCLSIAIYLLHKLCPGIWPLSVWQSLAVVVGTLDYSYTSLFTYLLLFLFIFFLQFLACDAFITVNHRTVLPWCSSVCLSGTGVHCDHRVYFSADLSLWLDSPMFWAPWPLNMFTYFEPSFSSSTWKTGGYGCTGQNQGESTVLWFRLSICISETVLQVKGTR